MTSPQQVQDQLTAYLRNTLGLGTAGIAGVEGNLQIESGFSTTIVNPGEGAIGLAQWEKDRRTGPAGLQHFAAAHGLTETDPAAQIGFLGAELQGPFASVLAALRTAATPAAAAAIFDSGYERSAGTSRQARIDAATAIGGTGSIASAGTGTAASTGGVQPAGFLGLPTIPSLSDVGHYLLDGAAILAGIALVVTAVVLIAKGGDSGQNATVTVAPTDDADHKRVADGAAEDGAEVAAA